MKSLPTQLAIWFFRMVILSMVLAYIMALIEGLRTVGTNTPFYLPFSQLGQYQPRLVSDAVASNPVAMFIDNYLYLYNCAFPGASRMGHGIGTLAACFWSLHSASSSSRNERIVMGAIVGAVIGFRIVFMVTSNSMTLIYATALGLIGFAVSMALSDRKPPIPTIPIVKLN